MSVIDPVAAATAPNPYDYYARLIEERPLHYDEGLRLWVAASASVVSAVLTHPHFRVRPGTEPVPQVLVGSAAGGVFGSLVRMSDGAAHRSLRPAVERAFEALSPATLARTSHEAARRFASHRPCDGDRRRAMAFAFRFPVQVMATLLGVPDDRLADASVATEAFAAGLTPIATPDQRARASAAAEHLVSLVAPIPADGGSADFLSAFRRAARHQSIGDDRLVANAVGFLFQTCEATAGLIGNTIVALGRMPQMLDLVIREPERLRDAADEVLRFDAPVQNTRRFVESAAIVEGRQIPAGDGILVLLAAANRDPAANPHPDRFELSRANRRLFTFGAGAHACPGRELAVTIATAAVRRLVDDGLDPRPLSESFSYRPSVNVRVPMF
jgi:cytochrome P450